MRGFFKRLLPMPVRWMVPLDLCRQVVKDLLLFVHLLHQHFDLLAGLIFRMRQLLEFVLLADQAQHSTD